MKIHKGGIYWHEVSIYTEVKNNIAYVKVRIPVMCDKSGEYASTFTYLDPNERIFITKDILNESLFDNPNVSIFQEVFDFKAMRKQAGLTLREVEGMTGISNSYLSQLETGKIKNPSYNNVRILVTLYDLHKRYSKL